MIENDEISVPLEIASSTSLENLAETARDYARQAPRPTIQTKLMQATGSIFRAGAGAALQTHLVDHVVAQ